MRFSRFALTTMLAAAIPMAARAQEQGIWVRCELAPGTQRGAHFNGIYLIGNDLMRRYDEAARGLEAVNQCGTQDSVAQCALTEDEFTIERRNLPDDGYPFRSSGRIDRRTGSASYAASSETDSWRTESTCQGTTDPRPPRAF